MLGFSELVQEGSFSDNFKKYSEILSNAVEANKEDLQYVTFSDSVVINTKKDDGVQLQYLIQTVADISFHFLTELNIPICGSISIGEFDRHEHKDGNVMIAGRPIIDAYQYERKQDWIGVMLSPKVIRNKPNLVECCRLPRLNSVEDGEKLRKCLPLWPFILQKYYDIPFRNQNNVFEEHSRYSGFVIVPQRYGWREPEEVIGDLGKYKEKLEELKLFAPEPSAQMKYQYALNWIGYVEGKLRDVIGTSFWRDSHKVK